MASEAWSLSGKVNSRWSQLPYFSQCSVLLFRSRVAITDPHLYSENPEQLANQVFTPDELTLLQALVKKNISTVADVVLALGENKG